MHYLSTLVAFSPRSLRQHNDSAYSLLSSNVIAQITSTLVYLGHVDLISVKSIVDPRFNEILSR